MTNYESFVYTVDDQLQGTSAAFSTLPGAEDPPHPVDHVLKLWHTTTLPDGQAINVSVLFELADVRGLQSWLNDQFGRGTNGLTVTADGSLLNYKGRNYVPQTDVQQLPESAADIVKTAIANLQLQGYTITGPDGTPGVYVADIVPAGPIGAHRPDGFAGTADEYNESHGSERLATSDGLPGMLEPSDLSGGWADSRTRQCPVIYNGVQCAKPEGHPEFHEFVQDWLQVQPARAEEAADTPTDLQPVAEERDGAAFTAAGLATGEGDPEAPAKKKVNRRKKEEKAYDDALEAFRAHPDMQTRYTDLVNAAEALRKRFPNDSRLVAYDLHVQYQDINWLTDSEYGIVPESRNTSNEVSASVQDGPHFAPESTPQAAPTPFVPPATTQHPDGIPAASLQEQADRMTAKAVEMIQGSEVSPEEAQAAQAFPCQYVSEVSGRRCIRAAGHDLVNPPKPHIYAPLPDGEQLPVPSFIPPAVVQGEMNQQPGFTVTPVSEAQGFSQSSIPPFQTPQPTQSAAAQGQTVLSFQVPPVPEPGDQQPPAPAAPPWGQG